MIWGACS